MCATLIVRAAVPENRPQGFLGMLPGMGKMKKMVDQAGGLDDKEIVRQEAIISSMTKAERKKPALMNAKRKKRRPLPHLDASNCSSASSLHFQKFWRPCSFHAFWRS